MLALDDMLHQIQDGIQEVLTTENSIKGCILAKRKEKFEFDSTNGWRGSQIITSISLDSVASSFYIYTGWVTGSNIFPKKEG